MKKFGPTAPEPYPAEMRSQLWPLCCGAAIISGFKDAATLAATTPEKLLKQINEIADEAIPDHQVYLHENLRPKIMFLTLNSSQMASKKIMDAIKGAGFVKFATAEPRGTPQGFFVRDKSNSFKAA